MAALTVARRRIRAERAGDLLSRQARARKVQRRGLVGRRERGLIPERLVGLVVLPPAQAARAQTFWSLREQAARPLRAVRRGGAGMLSLLWEAQAVRGRPALRASSRSLVERSERPTPRLS